MENGFQTLNLPPKILQGLNKIGFRQPTEIQSLATPPALEGRDLFASAQTGSGKTLAFTLPALNLALKFPQTQNSVVVLTPTRELAEQILKVVKDLSAASELNLKVGLLIGGTSMLPQLRNLQKGAHIIIGTPGRVLDHLRRGSLKLKQSRMLVLDECDRMLDMGFAPQIQAVLRDFNTERQTLLFSATLPPEIEKLARTFMKNPIRVGSVLAKTLPPTEITQHSIQVSQNEKPETLIKEISKRSGASAIVFTRTKSRSDRLSSVLFSAGLKADRIHGGRNQKQRSSVLKKFRDGALQVLVATDVAARGIDVPNVGLVVNFDLPQSPEDFVHRLGRTGRAGATGEAISLVSQDEAHLWRSIQRFISGEKDVPSRGGGYRSGGQRRGSSRNTGGRPFRGGGRGDSGYRKNSSGGSGSRFQKSH